MDRELLLLDPAVDRLLRDLQHAGGLADRDLHRNRPGVRINDVHRLQSMSKDVNDRERRTSGADFAPERLERVDVVARTAVADALRADQLRPRVHRAQRDVRAAGRAPALDLRAPRSRAAPRVDHGLGAEIGVARGPASASCSRRLASSPSMREGEVPNRKPSPVRAARRSATGVKPPNQIGMRARGLRQEARAVDRGGTSRGSRSRARSRACAAARPARRAARRGRRTARRATRTRRGSSPCRRRAAAARARADRARSPAWRPAPSGAAAGSARPW